MADYRSDPRIVMTLDAGRTGLKFSAIRGAGLLVGPVARPTEAESRERCLANIVDGFEQVKRLLPEPPAAISFAFPGPADYPAGIIAGLQNFPAFRDAVPLGPILEERFGIPVYINNDGDLFAYGEAISGFLPYVNGLLAEAGNPKRYRNLFGVTLGTGLGGGIVRNGDLFLGDNSAGGEAWLLRNKLDPSVHAEEGASIRGIRRAYAAACGIAEDRAPEPKLISEIAMGQAAGDRAAALEAFRRMGEVAGDALAQALTLIDGLAVIGGGIAGSHPLFLEHLVRAMNAPYEGYATRLRRLAPLAFNIEDPLERKAFLQGEVRSVEVPGSGRKILYDPLRRTAVGITRLGTSEAVAVGAYAFALRELTRSS
ncbi:MAG TPA: ROK family protein [Candidatus Sulfopaludibacter sp.]|nr:ROK family protein [Candidatus Sulfopaludibacter sp.]